MTRHVLLIRIALAFALVSPPLLAAQQATAPPGGPPQAPAGGRGGGRGAAIKSPEIAADGRVTFRLRAPNAKEVLVALGQTRLPMQKDEQGVWSATSDVLAPNYYTYSFVIDGTTVNDAANRRVETSFGSSRSMFVIPGPEPWLPDPACREARSRGILSDLRSRTTNAISWSTRPQDTNPNVRERIRRCTCSTDLAMTLNDG